MNRQKEQRLRMWRKRLNSIKRVKPGKTLLDVGCGAGTFLDLVRQDGWSINGTEVSAYASDYASRRLNTDIYHGELVPAGFEEDTFDVVTMWHVLEHVEDPMAYLLEIKRVLKPQGLLVLAVPNVDNRVFQAAYRIIKGRKLKLFTMGEKEIHLYHFSVKTIQAYLRQTGFECVRLSPDFGIINVSKKAINWFAVLFYYLFRLHIYDAMEIYAIAQKQEKDKP
jgi:ubiquinone/menaquinone biosynthesis C-methylase UbiE